MVFADKNLEAAVRKALEKPEEPLTKGVIRELTSLHTSMPLIETEIEVLFGIDSAVNLTKLNLTANPIKTNWLGRNAHVSALRARGVDVSL